MGRVAVPEPLLCLVWAIGVAFTHLIISWTIPSSLYNYLHYS